jgi:hypothetical protein
MGVHLRSILTSSQKPIRRSVMVSSRDRSIVSVEMTMRSSPGRRRLRFSFQINDVKDPNRLCRPRRLAPDVGGGGYLWGGRVPVKRPSPKISTNCGFVAAALERRPGRRPTPSARGAPRSLSERAPTRLRASTERCCGEVDIALVGRRVASRGASRPERGPSTGRESGLAAGSVQAHGPRADGASPNR